MHALRMRMQEYKRLACMHLYMHAWDACIYACLMPCAPTGYIRIPYKAPKTIQSPEVLHKAPTDNTKPPKDYTKHQKKQYKDNNILDKNSKNIQIIERSNKSNQTDLLRMFNM